MTDASFTAAGYAILTVDDPEIFICQKIIRSNCIWLKNFYTITTQNVHIRQGILSNLLRIQRIWTYFLGIPQTDHYPNGQQIGHKILPDEDNPSNTLECM